MEHVRETLSGITRIEQLREALPDIGDILTEMYQGACFVREAADPRLSHFRVGTEVARRIMAQDGQEVAAVVRGRGANSERAGDDFANHSEPRAISEMRNAWVAAGLPEDEFAIEMVVVVGDTEAPLASCGACRGDLFDNMVPGGIVVFANMHGDVQIVNIEDLFPVEFPEIEPDMPTLEHIGRAEMNMARGVYKSGIDVVRHGVMLRTADERQVDGWHHGNIACQPILPAQMALALAGEDAGIERAVFYHEAQPAHVVSGIERQWLIERAQEQGADIEVIIAYPGADGALVVRLTSASELLPSNFGSLD